MTTKQVVQKLGIALTLAGAAWAAQAQPNVNVSVDGVIRPGVYGRVVIGTGNPPPQVIYPQPVIITQPAVVVQQAPIYMNVPHGHSKKWSKHCHKYNACNQPVYFVQAPGHSGEHGHGRKHDDDHGGKHGGKHGGTAATH
jgi:hypothetical protein